MWTRITTTTDTFHAVICLVTGYKVNFKKYMSISKTLNSDEMMPNYDIMFHFVVFPNLELFAGWIPEEYKKTHYTLYLAIFY